MDYIIGYFFIPIIFLFSLLAFALNFFWKKKQGLLLKYVRIYGVIFFITTTLLYFISISEAFDNLELGSLSLLNYLNNFFNVLYYFFTWVLLPFWVLPLFIISLLITLVVFFIRYLINKF